MTHTDNSSSAVRANVQNAFADEGPGPNAGKTVVIGCGNILRGDDAVGPTLIRHLWAEGDIPDEVTLVDGGTAGMDVAFKMRGAAHVVLIDAAQTGADPGTIYRIPGSEIEELPALEALHSHSFRWDHALAFGHWLLGDQYPEEVTVFLVEIANTEPGADLTEPVAASMLDVGRHVRDVWAPADPSDHPIGHTPATGGRDGRPGDHLALQLGDGAAPDEAATVEITADGNLRLDVEVAQRFFPADALVAVPRGAELWLMPLTGPEGGGLLLKQRNPRGDRSTLIWEVLPPGTPAGRRQAVWDDANGALRVDLSPSATASPATRPATPP